MPRKGSSGGGGGRRYVDNAMNRSLGRVGMSLGSASVSRSSNSPAYSGNSSRCYVDNVMNRNLGRVGQTLGTASVSRNSSSGSTYNNENSRTYVDNVMNRNLGRVGQTLGTASVSRNSSSGSTYNNENSRTYVDNVMNRNLGRVGQTLGTASVSRNSSSGSTYNNENSRTYVDNVMNRNLGRAGQTLGTASVSRNSTYNNENSRTYVDNVMNRNLGRVGQALGSASVSRNFISGSTCNKENSRTYVDNVMNRNLGRVGQTLGSAPVSKSSNERTVSTFLKNENAGKKMYVDNAFNRRLGRVGEPLGSKPRSSKGAKKNQNCYVDNYLNRRLGRVGKPLGSMEVSSKDKPKQKLKEAFQAFQDKQNDLNSEGMHQDVGHCYNQYTDHYRNEQEYQYFYEEIHEHIERNQVWETEKTRKHQELHDCMNIIQYEDLEISEQKLGHGGFGDIYAAEWNGHVVAVKKLRVQRVSKKRLQQFEDEVSIFCRLNHENIIQFFGACIKTPNLCIVMELMQASLYDKIHVEGQQFSDEDKLLISYETAKGLKYLHDNGIAHCDMKSKNILVAVFDDAMLCVKLADFGLSLVKSESETTTSSKSKTVAGMGTPRYSAPEVLRGEMLTRDQMIMADIYSYGLIVFEIYSEEEPFDDLNMHQLRKQVGEGERLPSLKLLEDAPQSFIAQVQACWSRYPQQRPNMATICRSLAVFFD